MDTNPFERATRDKLRFPSPIGDLTIEDVWDLPLKGRVTNGRPAVDLDTVARTIHLEIKGLDEVSFVDTKPDPRKAGLETKLEIVKHVIATKQAERDAAKTAAETAERKRKLLAALASKEEQDLAGMTREQIEAEIAKL